MTDLVMDSCKTAIMGDMLHPGYQDVLTQNYHIFSRYLYAEDFIAELISKEVLSTNDKEFITNPYVNQTRRQKTTALIDVLLTKGPDGYDCFLEILEFQYPHVYKDVTKREPRPLPKGRHRNRHSDRLLLLENLPNLAAHIKEQYKQNEKLNMQLSVLEGLMTDSHVEKSELEKELESLKKVAKDREREAAVFKAQNDRLQADVNRLHEEKVTEMEKSHKFRDERDDLKQKVQELVIEREQREKSKEGRRPSDATSMQTINNLHIHEQNKILKQQLEEWTEQANDYADRLTTAETRETHLRAYIKTVKQELEKELKKRKKEQEILEREKNELKRKNETYLELIKQKTDKMFAMEDQKREVENKIRQVEREKEKLFEEVHRLEDQLQQAHSQLERLTARLSRSSQEMSSSAEEGQEDVIELPAYFAHVNRQNFRRTNLKCTDRKWKGLLDAEDSDSELEGNSEPEENLDARTSNTLPTGSGKFDSPEFIFQQEVAHLRWSMKEKKPANISASIEVQVGSIKRNSPRLAANREKAVEKEFVQQIFPSNFILQDNIPERGSGPVVHSDDPNDTNDAVSTSTGSLVPREPAWSKEEVVRRQHNDPMSPTDYGRPHGIKAIHISTELGSDFPSHDVYSVLLPRCLEVVRPSGIQLNSSVTTVTVKLPILNDKFEIRGGNHTGIFVSKVNNKMCNLMVGDQIKEVIYTPNEVADPVVAPLQGCSIDEAYRLLSEEFIRRRKEKEVKLRLRKSHQEYELVKQWIVENGGTGDFFYIRCNYEKKESTQQQSGEETTLKPGEIFLVRDTRCDQRLWEGYKINEVTGNIESQLIRIFNKSWYIPTKSRDTTEAEDRPLREKRHLAFKCKGQVYERVLPMKASVKLPVILFGPDVVVEATMNLIDKNLGQQFTVKRPGETSDPENFELYRQDSHSVWKGKLDKISSSQKHIQKIIFLLKITSEEAIDSLRIIFGSSFTMTINKDTVEQGRYLQEKLVEKGFHIEELCFPELTFKDTLLDKFRSCVQSSQDRILWLSKAEMDSSVAEKYLTYLGPDLSAVMLSLQHAQSLDESFVP